MTVGAVGPLAIRGSGGCCCGLPAAAAAAHPRYIEDMALRRNVGSARDHQTRIPPRGSAVLRRCDRSRREPDAFEKPRDHGVRVPHLARPQLVPPPDRSRDRRNELDEPTRELLVVTHALWAVNRFGDVRNDTVAPTSHLVAEQPKTTSPSSSHGAFRDDAAFTVPSTRRPLLDHEAPLGQAHDESGVVEVAPLPSLSQRNDGLEKTTVESNRVATCTEWQPVEIDA